MQLTKDTELHVPSAQYHTNWAYCLWGHASAGELVGALAAQHYSEWSSSVKAVT